LAAICSSFATLAGVLIGPEVHDLGGLPAIPGVLLRAEELKAQEEQHDRQGGRPGDDELPLPNL
jgi:hypothetical protein